MLKRIALFILGLALMLGAFLLYQYVSGPDALGGKKPKRGLTTGPATLPMSYEARDDNGNLLYVISASKSPEPIRDENQNPLPGQFLMSNPLATFYDPGRTIQVRATTCRMIVEQGPKRAGAPGAPGGTALPSKLDTITVREGMLEGDVRMTINPTLDAPPVPNDLLAGGLRVYLDGTLHLDGIKEVLTTPGGIHIRSQKIDFDARGLQLAFNRKAKRIDFMGIDHGDKVVIRDLDPKMFSLDETTKTAPATSTKTAPAASATTPAASQPAKAPTTYRMSFAQDVKAVYGANSLTSDRLYLLFMAAGELAGPATATAPATGAAAAPAPIASTAPVLRIPDTPGPIAPARATDLVVNWTGPLVIRPADETDLKLSDERDVVLDAQGTAAKPVQVSSAGSGLADARFNVQAGRLWYHKAEQRILLTPDAFKKVILTDLTRNNVECGELSINQAARHAVLGGPGTLISKSNTTTMTATWKTHLDLDLESTPNPADPKKTLFAIRHALLYGAAVKSDAFDLKCDTLDLLIANSVDKGKQIQALDHLIATGNVVVNSFRKGAGPAAGPQSGMQTRRMEIFTEKRAGKLLPEPSQLLAEGDVFAWRFLDKNKAAAAADPANIQKESIVTSKLVATLVSNDAAATAPATAPGNDLAFMGRIDVSHFLASNGAKVEITPPPSSKSEMIVATAATLDAFPLKGDKGTATLLAAAGGPPVRVTIGVNAIEGRTINLDQNAKSIQVPGPGTFNFTLPPNKTRKTATPMIVTWQESMAYDDLKHLAIFTGKPVARILAADAAAPDQSDQSHLACENTLTIQLKTIAPASAPAASAPADPLAFGNIDLDWMQADGNVEAFGSQLGPDNKLLTRLRISVPNPTGKLGSLRYSKSDNNFVVDCPGALVIDNFRPDKAGELVSSAGTSIFGWKGGLKYDGAANTITFSQNVDFFFQPLKPFRFANDLSGGAASAPAAGSRPLDMIYLHTPDKLIATLTKPKDSTGKTIDSPIGFGAGGNQDVSKVDATGGPEFLVGYRTPAGNMDPNIAYRVAGDAMTFDVPAHIAYMFGKGEEPAVAEQPATGRRMTGKNIKLDMTKDKMFFQVEGIQGNLTGFGG